MPAWRAAPGFCLARNSEWNNFSPSSCICLHSAPQNGTLVGRYSGITVALGWRKSGVLPMQSHSCELQKAEVLLCSSDTLQKQLLAKELKRHGFRSIEACGGGLEECRQALLYSAAEVLVLLEGLKSPSRLMVGWVPELLRKFPELRVILVHGWSSQELTVEAVVAGVRGLFSQEQQTLEAMAKCIQRVREGELWLNSTEVLHLTDALSKRRMSPCRTRATSPLTARQQELVQLVAEGMGNRDIALQLGVTENTVKKHLGNIYEKLGVSSRVELVLSRLQVA
jgi:DNA-binding NarL/FixJ family response regulator